MIEDFYSYDDIDALDCRYNIIIGERSNGKTYGFKLKALKNYIENGKQFAYIRRTAEEIKIKRTKQYFGDMQLQINQMMHKKYPDYDRFKITPLEGCFNLYGVDKKLDSHKLGVVGFYFALNQSAYDKTVQYPDVNLICYEEFLSKNTRFELDDEFDVFQDLISTIIRRRTDIKIYMLGNAVNRNSRILSAMNINIRDLTRGSIKVYEYSAEDGRRNRVAVELCRTYEKSVENQSIYTFGTNKEKNILCNEWDIPTVDKFYVDELIGKRADLSLVLATQDIRIYIYYVSATNTAYATSRRIKCISDKPFENLPYYTISTDRTDLTRKTFNINSDLPFVQNLFHVLESLQVNRHIQFDSDETGSDFDAILGHKLHF